MNKEEIRAIIMDSEKPVEELTDFMKNKISETIDKCIFVAIVVDVILWCVTLYITNK